MASPKPLNTSQLLYLPRFLEVVEELRTAFNMGSTMDVLNALKQTEPGAMFVYQHGALPYCAIEIPCAVLRHHVFNFTGATSNDLNSFIVHVTQKASTHRRASRAG